MFYYLMRYEYYGHRTTDVAVFVARLSKSRAIAQAVSRRLPTAVALFRSQVRSHGIYGGQIFTRAVFSEYFHFPGQF
jgi:hypothetical protein